LAESTSTIFVFAAQTIRFAVRRDIETHHRWAFRTIAPRESRRIDSDALAVTKEQVIKDRGSRLAFRAELADVYTGRRFTKDHPCERSS
jgi:hypothetical protein